MGPVDNDDAEAVAGKAVSAAHLRGADRSEACSAGATTLGRSFTETHPRRRGEFTSPIRHLSKSSSAPYRHGLVPLNDGGQLGITGSRGGWSGRFTVRGLVKRIAFHTVPTLSLVPEAREPPKGCWPTAAPVGLSLTT